MGCFFCGTMLLDDEKLRREGIYARLARATPKDLPGVAATRPLGRGAADVLEGSVVFCGWGQEDNLWVFLLHYLSGVVDCGGVGSAEQGDNPSVTCGDSSLCTREPWGYRVAGLMAEHTVWLTATHGKVVAEENPQVVLRPPTEA